MLILNECTDYGIVPIIKIIRTLFLMIQIIGPTLAIVSIGIIIIRAISAGDKNNVDKSRGKIINSLIALLLTIFLPVLVNVVMGLTMMQNTFKVAACWDEAYSVNLDNKYNSENKDGTETDGNINSFVIKPEDYKNKGNNTDNGKGNIKPNTVSSNGMADAFVNLAVAQKQDPSAKGGKKYWQYIGKKKHTAWCAAFVSWIIGNTEYNGEKMTKYFNFKSQSSGKFIKYCKRHEGSTYYQRGYVPKRGDLIFYDWDNNGVQNHIGIVQYVKGGKIKTIEGNCGDKIKERTIDINNKVIFGFCSWY